MKVLVFTFAIIASTLATEPFKYVQHGVHFRKLFVDPAGLDKSTPIHPRIINGEEAEPHSIPYQAWLTISGTGGKWLCGGSLVSKKFVLTAGHCLDGGSSVEVLLGAHDITTTEPTQVKLTSTKLTVHPQYDINTISNDIAILELDEPVELTDAIQTVQLPTRKNIGDLYENEPCKVSGWGLTDGFGNTVSPVLNYAESTILPNRQCKSIFSILLDSEICMSGATDKSSCNGDSGGPLTVDGVQVGIVSYGIRYCLSGYPSAFTRVTSYLDWIEENSDLDLN